MLTRCSLGHPLHRYVRLSFDLVKRRSLTSNRLLGTVSSNPSRCFSQVLKTKAEERFLFPRSFSISSSRFSSVVQFKLADIGEGIREVEVKEWYVRIPIGKFVLLDDCSSHL